MSVDCPECRRVVPGELPLCQYCGARLRPPVSCKACGHTISGGLAKCPYCNASADPAPSPAPIPSTPLPGPPPPPTKTAGPPSPDRLRIDLRARVLWGEERGALRTEFLKQGFTAREVDAALDEAIQERHAHFRRLGMRDLLIGGACCAGFVLALGAFALLKDSGRVGMKSVRVLGALYLAMLGLPAAAAFFFIRGARRILKGGHGERDASDLKEGD